MFIWTPNCCTKAHPLYALMQAFMVGQMLKRNMGVKPAPERWQDSAVAFDVVVTFEERIMEQLLDGGCFVIQSRRQCSASGATSLVC